MQKLPVRNSKEKQEPSSAFHLFKEDMLVQVKKENPDLKPHETTKLIAQNWVSADEKTRDRYEKRFQELNTNNEEKIEQDKVPLALESYTLKKQQCIDFDPIYYDKKDDDWNKPESVAIKKEKKKLEVPEEPLSAFGLFKKDVLEKTKSENPKAKPNEIIKIIAQTWVQTDESIRKEYEQKQEQLTKEYEENAQIYQNEKNFLQTVYGQVDKPAKSWKEPKMKEKSIDSNANDHSYDYPDEDEESYEEEDEEEEEEEEEEDYEEEGEDYEEEGEEEYYAKKELKKVCQKMPKPVSILKAEKSPLTGLAKFREEVLQTTVKENPEATMSEITKIIAQKWVKLDEETRNKYA